MHNLRVSRAIKRVTQIQLSEMACINQGRISMAENGWIRLTPKEEGRIEEALGLKIRWNGESKEGD